MRGSVAASGPPACAPARRRWFRPVTILVPTLRTWVIAATVLSLLAWLAIRHVHDFLAPTRPLAGAKVLVVEASPTPGIVRYVKTLIDNEHYERVLFVGMPIDRLSPLATFGTDADLWVARLARAGVSPSSTEVIRLPAFSRHRTAHKALAVRRHLDARPVDRVDLVSPTTHARRSWLIYRRALAPTEVGIRSAPQPYDPRAWWNSSAGVRAVIGELLALAYFYVGRDEVAQARAEWAELPAEVRLVSPPTVLRREQ